MKEFDLKSNFVRQEVAVLHLNGSICKETQSMVATWLRDVTCGELDCYTGRITRIKENSNFDAKFIFTKVGENATDLVVTQAVKSYEIVARD